MENSGFGKGRACLRGAYLLAAAVVLAGCGQALPTPPLSDIVNVPGGVLNSDEQRRAIQEMSDKKSSVEAGVERQIAKGR